MAPRSPLAVAISAAPHAATPSLAAMKADAARCRRCPLYRDTTGTVFGEGPPDAAMVLVGEQPGDQEDRLGRPFVGPAGRLLDQALAAAAIDRRSVYLTNAVKHFKHERRGKRRIHQKPNAGEVVACRWWIGGELALLRPAVVVALGATAALALAGHALAIGQHRGCTVDFGGYRGRVTMHPSAILRMRDAAERATALAALVDDLRAAAALVAQPRVTRRRAAAV
jgi:DNA polymerase